MVLSNEELKKYICGAVYFEETDGLISYRFTKEKLNSADDKARKIRQSTATGIKIDFYSDTEELSFDYTAYTGFSSELYELYFFDIYADGALVLHQGEKNVFEDRCGRINVKFKTGNKRITVYLPGSCSVKITGFSISGGAKISPVNYNGKALFLGDSITHAAYVDFPSLTYVNRVSERLNKYTVNEAIGGDVFSLRHLENLPDIPFDTVFAAYGSNDWASASISSPERIADFLGKLNEVFPDSEKNVILPIWRADMFEHNERPYPFEEIRKFIRDSAEKYNMNVIDLFDFIPKEPLLFHDGYLHPNEMGFAFYADGVLKHLNG